MTKTKQLLDHWINEQNLVHIYRVGCLLLGGIALLLTILCVSQSSGDALILFERGSEKQFLVGRKMPLQVSDDDVRQFVREYVNTRYNWEAFNSEQLLRNLGPICTSGFIRRLEELFHKDTSRGKALIEKSAAIHVVVALNENKIVTSFDQIAHINGIPLPIPTQLALTLVQGEVTRWNPFGLYVDGMSEHENK